jgi:hypothetical protein
VVFLAANGGCYESKDVFNEFVDVFWLLRKRINRARGQWGFVDDHAYLAGIGIKDIGGLFTITSIDLLGWDDNNDELSAAGKACDSGTSSAANRACAFAGTPDDRVLSSTGPLTIVIGVALTTGALDNNFHFKVRWEDLAGNKVGSLISDDLTAVPLPAAVWLFGSALMGLTVVARRRDRKAPLVA